MVQAPNDSRRYTFCPVAVRRITVCTLRVKQASTWRGATGFLRSCLQSERTDSEPQGCSMQVRHDSGNARA